MVWGDFDFMDADELEPDESDDDSKDPENKALYKQQRNIQYLEEQRQKAMEAQDDMNLNPDKKDTHNMSKKVMQSCLNMKTLVIQLRKKIDETKNQVVVKRKRDLVAPEESQVESVIVDEDKNLDIDILDEVTSVHNIQSFIGLTSQTTFHRLRGQDT